MRTDITKTPMYLLKSKKTISTSKQHCILIGQTGQVTTENESEYSIALTQKVFSGSGHILYSYWLDGSCDYREQIRVQCCSDVEIVFLLSNSFSDIGAHQDFEMPEFFMPRLLIKELCREWPRRAQHNLSLLFTNRDRVQGFYEKKKYCFEW